MNTPATHTAPVRPATPARDQAPEMGAPEVGAWLRQFLALLMHWAGLLDTPKSPEARALAQAIRAIQDLVARHADGDLPWSDVPHGHPCTRAPYARIRYARIPRAERRILLTPGIFAALFFTPRAFIAARARIAARAEGILSALRALSRTPVSIFGHHTQAPTHILFVPLS
jgi:hypothetical protein